MNNAEESNYWSEQLVKGREDTKRLDWLEENEGIITQESMVKTGDPFRFAVDLTTIGYGDLLWRETIREAIDAAMDSYNRENTHEA